MDGEENIPDACFDLAVFYEKGIQTKKNNKKAFEYYLKAVLYGDKDSYFEVGRCFYYGIGIARNKYIGKIRMSIYEKNRVKIFRDI